MIKLLYKPTGNVFTLPDAEALKIKNNDRCNDYVILDAGLQEKEEATISKEEVKKIEAQQEELKSNETTSTPPKNESKSRRKVFDASDIKKLKKEELAVLASKVGIPDPTNKKKEELIRLLQEKTGKDA